MIWQLLKMKPNINNTRISAGLSDRLILHTKEQMCCGELPNSDKTCIALEAEWFGKDTHTHTHIQKKKRPSQVGSAMQPHSQLHYKVLLPLFINCIAFEVFLDNNHKNKKEHMWSCTYKRHKERQVPTHTYKNKINCHCGIFVKLCESQSIELYT